MSFILVAYSKDYIDLIQHGKDLKQYYAEGTNFLISLNFFVRQNLTNEEVPIFVLDDSGIAVLAISINKEGIFYRTRNEKHFIKLNYIPSNSLNIRLKQENGEIKIFSDCVVVFKEKSNKHSDNNMKDFPDKNILFLHQHVSILYQF